MAKRNVFYAQSGGVTAVINASASGVIETARRHRDKIGKVYAGRNGILGALREELIDTSKESTAAIRALCHTPGGAFGSARYKLKGLDEHRAEYERLIEVFRAHDIGYYFYTGDNDQPITDTCPGFGSVAKYIATSIREAAFDVASMAETSTKVFILEVMGRHAGWIAAAAGLACEAEGDAPHVILFPERVFDEAAFLARVAKSVKRYGHCVVAVSEGIKDAEGRFLSESGGRDAFGHAQLGGVAPRLAQLVKDRLGFKYHWAVADYLQRSARHIASKTDVEQAYAVGRAAVELAIKGENAVMPAIIRTSDRPYRWHIGVAPLAKVANVEKKMPRNFISRDGFHITEACRRYLQPLIAGESYPPYKSGLPQYVRLKNVAVAKKLKTPFDVKM